MNPGINSDHPSIHYYDSDYPSPFDTQFPENFDSVTEYQGLASDLARYRELVAESGGPVLELGCGTGRVSIPLARDGFEVTAVDLNPGMLQQFRNALEQQPCDVSKRIKLVEQDATRLELQARKFKTAIFAFNTLLCIPNFSGQRAALQSVARHMERNGCIIIDIVNPLQLNIQGDPIPKPFFTRKDRHTGNMYTRFAMMGPFEADQKQRLHGWYDEILQDGTVKRAHYSLYWRPIFRFEIELMLKEAGLDLHSIEGGHRKEPFTAQSPRMLLRAVRRAEV